MELTVGYKRPAKVYKLVFADEDMAGLEVKARSIPMGELLDMAPLLDMEVSATPTAAEVAEMRGLLQRFAGVLVSWNLEDDDDTPVPATFESLLAQDVDFVLRIVKAWGDAISGVSAPLEQPSPGGALSLAASIPMAVS